jgi:hypothetical protein
MLYPLATPKRDAAKSGSCPTKTRDAGAERVDRPSGRQPRKTGNKTMTVEILYLTTQLQSWLNRQVAHYLEAEAAKFGR